MKRPNVHVPLSALAKQKPPDIGLSNGAADEIACLAYMLAQEELRAVDPLVGRSPWADAPVSSRLKMRAGVVRVVQALVLLGYIEP